MIRKSCKGCYFYRKFDGNRNEYACHYCLDVGKLRGVPAEECDKKLPVTPAQRKKINRLRRNDRFDRTSEFLKLVGRSEGNDGG